jgi:hypothetical protein
LLGGVDAIEAAAAFVISCESGFASSMPPAPSNATSSIPAIVPATKVARRQGRTSSVGVSSGASKGSRLRRAPFESCGL